MRFFSSSSAAVVAAAALLFPAAAVADSPAATTSATTTHYTTLTVLRVVQITTATRNATLSAETCTSTEILPVPLTTSLASTASHLVYSNATATVLGTGAGPSAPASASGSSSAPIHTGAAMRVEAFGFAAVAGLVGLAVL